MKHTFSSPSLPPILLTPCSSSSSPHMRATGTDTDTTTPFLPSAATFSPPSILLTVSGTVSHHTPESSSALNPSSTSSSSAAPKSATSSTHGANRNRGNFDPDAPITSHPRAFSQNFVLVDIAAVGGTASGDGGVACSSATGKDASVTLSGRYFVQADSFRFVG